MFGVETKINIPKELTFTFINSEGKKRKCIIFGSIFICYHCGFQQHMILLDTNSQPFRMKITEHHAQTCRYIYGKGKIQQTNTL
jgi:hypothetical protein